MSEVDCEIVVEEADRGWEVRIGPDVLLSEMQEADAVQAAEQHRKAMVGSGKAVSYVVKRRPPPRLGRGPARPPGAALLIRHAVPAKLPAMWKRRDDAEKRAGDRALWLASLAGLLAVAALAGAAAWLTHHPDVQPGPGHYHGPRAR